MAVNLGLGVVTIGAMAGACYGEGAPPPEWLEALENKEKGRDYVAGLTRKVAHIKREKI